MLHHLDTMFKDLENPGIRTRHVSGDTDPRSLESIPVEEFCVIGGTAFPATFGGRVLRIGAGHRREKDCRVSNGTRHGTRCILTMSNGNDPTATQQAKCGLDPYNTIRLGWADDRAIGLRADCRRA